MEDRYKIAFLGVVIVVLIFSCANKKTPTDCNINRGACIKDFLGGKIYFEISPRPVLPMRRLLFKVKLEDIECKKERIRIFLSMPGMEMGENFVNLKKVKEGVYEGTGVIIRCPSGKTVWRADLVLDKTKKVSFTFDLKDKR